MSETEASATMIRQALGRPMIPDYEAMAELDSLFARLAAVEAERDRLQGEVGDGMMELEVEVSRRRAAEARVEALEAALREVVYHEGHIFGARYCLAKCIEAARAALSPASPQSTRTRTGAQQ